MKDWDDVRYFLAVARHGNVTAAAQILGVNHSTVSRRIQSFENRLGFRLFDRLPTGYALTPAAEDLMADAEAVEQDVIALSRRMAAKDNRMTGTLRITAPEGMVSLVLMPHITAFTRRYPDLELELTATADIKSLNNREADLAFRATNRPPEGLVGRRLTGQGMAVFAARRYLADRGMAPEVCGTPDWFAAPDHAWVGLLEDKTVPKWVSDHYPAARRAARLDSIYTLLTAAQAGIGMALLPCRLADPDADLVRVPPWGLEKGRDIWILFHRDMRGSAKLRAFTDYFARIVVAERPLFEGTSDQFQ